MNQFRIKQITLSDCYKLCAHEKISMIFFLYFFSSKIIDYNEGVMMDSKNRKNLDVKYLHPFSPAPSHNGHRHSGSGAEGNTFLKINTF